ncbi:odorant-binding protein [Culex quinquefasciatus]|uniref:Odorant-binding protein n=1 Tax=Culex quinquefasciatus TaxID=7176 RepID=B0W3U2_CULQU|nr:general odorant-binding protein 67 [Culex quinquefasciatus]XP_039448439.1 general odorant-binding protein 67-like [Culex pipiens pallens]EDS32239.1 odorant-binding protein [Culex quinquefasciatus]|eukprot:XP_001843376.1 odorant-binding protein [Culex quinquefasciatus]
MKSTTLSVLVLLTIVKLTLAAEQNVPASCLNKKFKIDPFYCCPTPKLLNPTIVKQCLELFPAPKDDKDQVKPDCMSECVMNRTGIFNRKKGVNDEKAMDTFVEKLEDKVWVGVVENAVTDCLEQSETRRASFEADTKQLQKRFKNDRICSPAAGFIMECVHVSVYKNCPDKKFAKNETECLEIKKHLTQCPFYTIFDQKPTPKKN